MYAQFRRRGWGEHSWGTNFKLNKLNTRSQAKEGTVTKDESEDGPEAAENDGVPLQLDLHPDDGERGTAHAYKQTQKGLSIFWLSG
jgi:hypothetical protein